MTATLNQDFCLYEENEDTLMPPGSNISWVNTIQATDQVNIFPVGKMFSCGGLWQYGETMCACVHKYGLWSLSEVMNSAYICVKLQN